MSDQRRFKHGGVVYPVTESLDEELLKDADPALYHALLLFESVINTYVGPRYLAAAAAENIRSPAAVGRKLTYEPSPFLLATDLVFPIFALYRLEEQWSERTVNLPESVSTWEWAYVLPPLVSARAVEKLNPVLRMVSVVMREFSARSWDPEFEAGATLCDLSGIRKMVAGTARYGNYEPIEVQDKFFRAVVGRLTVHERDDAVDGEFDAYEGVDATLDVEATDGTVLEAVAAFSSGPAPVLVGVAPASGSKAGGSALVVDGFNFRLGTTPRVLVGGADASSVHVAHPTKIHCLAPEHDATPTFAADVQVIDADGVASNVLEGAFLFTTP